MDAFGKVIAAGHSDGHFRGNYGMQYALLRLCAPLALLAIVVLLGSSRDFAGSAENAAIAPRVPLRGAFELGHTFEGFASANWSLARYRDTKCALSFIPQRSGTLQAVWLCWKTAKGYGAGTLGVWTFELQTDDGHGRPSGKTIVRTDGMTQPPDGYWHIALPPATLKAGQEYHLVIYNTDPAPEQNWSSPNTIMSMPAERWNGDGVMSWDTRAWAPWGSRSNPVTPRKGSKAAYLLEYADGASEGMPYYSAKRYRIHGNARVGESLTWQQPDARIGWIGFPFFRIGTPPAPVDYVLATMDGQVLATGQLATPKQVATIPNWHLVALATPVVLRRGQAYRLYLQSEGCMNSDNCYAVYAPYTSLRIPQWPALTWGGETAQLCYFTDAWQTPAVPTDLSFSLQAAETIGDKP